MQDWRTCDHKFTHPNGCDLCGGVFCGICCTYHPEPVRQSACGDKLRSKIKMLEAFIRDRTTDGIRVGGWAHGQSGEVCPMCGWSVLLSRETCVTTCEACGFHARSDIEPAPPPPPIKYPLRTRMLKLEDELEQEHLRRLQAERLLFPDCDIGDEKDLEAAKRRYRERYPERVMEIPHSGGLCPSSYEEAESGPCVECMAKNIQIAELKAKHERYYELFRDAVKLAGERWEKLIAAEITIRRIRETCKDRFRMLRATIDSLNKREEQMVTLEWHHQRVEQLLERANRPFNESEVCRYWKGQYEAEASQCREADELVGWIRVLCDPGARASDPAARNAYAAWERYRAKYPKEPT